MCRAPVVPGNDIGAAMPVVLSVNVGKPAPHPSKDVGLSGIDKRPVDGPVRVRAPGPKSGGLGSGLEGDFIGDRKHHGGDDQAVSAYAREDLDAWEHELGRTLSNGFFGENLTTVGLKVTGALIGERWRIGADVVLEVTSPRIPCATFRGRMGVKGWLRRFTERGIPGAYLKVIEEGAITAGDPIDVVHRPDHDVTIGLAFRALTLEPDLVPKLRAAESLVREANERARRRGF